MSDYIPYQLRRLITQIDPRLDLTWQAQLQTIFSTIPLQQCHLIHQQILKPKQIHWDQDTQSFNYTAQHHIQDLIDEIYHAGMKVLAKKIFSSLDELKKYTDAHQIADYIESIINQIDKIDVEENLNLQYFKQKIRSEFIYHCAAAIVQKQQITPPKNTRQLNTAVIKAFINEVYLKQLLLGYWFQGVRPTELASQQQDILNTFLKQQQKIRQLEVIKTTHYIFAIAPNRNQDINPFSIRRFLFEDHSSKNLDHVYFNVATLALNQLDQLEHCTHFQWQISRIVSIETTVGPYVSELIEKIESYSNQHLIPKLMQPLDLSNFNIDEIIQKQLWNFEQDLVIHILQPVTKVLKELIQHQEEYNYLYVSMRQIMSHIVSYFHDFQQQPAIMFDKKANLLIGRLNSYIKLLEKRKNDIFILQSPQSWMQKHQEAEAVITELNKISKDALKKYKTLQLEIKSSERELAGSSNSFFSKILKTQQKLQDKVDELKQHTIQIRQNAYIDIIKIPKKSSKYTTYLEFDALISINHKERHYAFVTGDNGVDRLPILIQLPEDRNLFNLQEICYNLDFDVNLAKQKWLKTN